MIAKLNIEYPECPHCGSDRSEKIGSAALPDESFDAKASGIFRCGHCREDYQFLKPLPAKEQVFSPTAQCPHCSSFKTKAVKTGIVRRYHICLDPKCLKPFRTVRPMNERRSRQERTGPRNAADWSKTCESEH